MADTKTVTILDSWSAISEKTVFVLDRSAYFTQVSSGHKINGDCLRDAKKTAHFYENEPPLKQFDRSLWTCTVEAVVGYSRLVWDLFAPNQKTISILAFGVADAIERICSFKDEDQNLEQLMKSLAKRSHSRQKLATLEDISSYPNCSSDSIPIINGLEQALNDMARLTSAQIERKSTAKDNNGRIILISSFQNEDTVNKIIGRFEALLSSKNQTLNYCDLVIVNTFPISDKGPCSNISNFGAFKPSLHVKTYSVQSGRIIGGLLNNLCLQHHNLKSTTITGIPMKEEQNASSSSQYDVEIVHCSSIHEDILKSGSPLIEGVTEVIDRNGFPCDTFKLNWCTPRTTTIELTHCVATSRITAVDVNSRPSACLVNFLLHGRHVMLEIFKSKSNRMTTHVLASHGGELYVHSLATNQKLNIDSPSISDSLGGKVGDYRVNDFVEFMRQHTLTICPTVDDPLSRTYNLIKRQTLYWPTVFGHTILLNVPNLVGSLLTRIPKESMTQADVDECKKTIDSIIKHEKDGQPLPSISIVDIIKTSSKSRLDQLYKLFWNEIEYFLRVHSTTPEHESVLEYLLERHADKKGEERSGTKRAPSKLTLASPVKKQKVSGHLIPEISDLTCMPDSQTAIALRPGLSLLQSWSALYHQYHMKRCKPKFVGRMPTIVGSEGAVKHEGQQST